MELTFGIPREIYANFLALRAAMEEEHELDRLLPVILPRIFHGLGVALVVVLLIAAALGLFIARRATGRVAALSDAARRVGEGDLTVRVAPRGSDELDDLGRAFDRMVAELSEARSRLGYMQKLAAWQEVARRLAHEIKNPLTPIQLAVQELASKYRGGDPAYERLLGTAQEILTEEVGAIRRLVDDFSAFAKLPKVEPVPVDLGQVVDDFSRAHPEWQKALQVERRGPVGALCDRMLIRRVLANLVENAVQAAEAAGREPTVRIALAEGDSAASLFVDDNGPGVAGDARERIFDPYMTTKEHGTGLGLAIVRKIMLDHGGDVRVAEAPSPLGARASSSPFPSSARRDLHRLPRHAQRRASVGRLREQLAERRDGRRREPRFQPAAADPGPEDAGAVDGQRRGIQRLLGAVGERQPDRPRRIDPRRPRDQRRVVDVEVGEPPLVEPQDVAVVGRRQPIEPAKERLPEARVGDLRPFVDEPPLAIDADAGAPEPLDEGGVLGRLAHAASASRACFVRFAREGSAMERGRRPGVAARPSCAASLSSNDCARPARPA